MESMDNEQLASLIRGLQQWRDKHEACPPQSPDRAHLDKLIAECEAAIARTELARNLRVLYSPTATQGRKRLSNRKTPGKS